VDNTQAVVIVSEVELVVRTAFLGFGAMTDTWLNESQAALYCLALKIQQTVRFRLTNMGSYVPYA
jgi:hypothetical protein